MLVPNTSYRAEAFTRAAAAVGAAVTLASEEASSLAGARPEGLIALPLSRPEDAADEAARLSKRLPIDAVVGVDDGSVEAAAAIAARLGLPHNRPDAVRASRHKPRFRARLRDAGMPGPEFFSVSTDEEPDEAARRAPYPCVLKPTGLSGSRGVIRADDPSSFRAAFLRIHRLLDRLWEAGEPCGEREVLVEAFIPGREAALEGLLTAGELRVLCIWEKPDPLDGPFFEETIYLTPPRYPPNLQRRIAECVRNGVRALGLQEGPVHAEVRFDREAVSLIELNPRSIGGRCSRALHFRTGVTLEEIVLLHALCRPLPALEAEAGASGVMMLPVPGAGVLREVAGTEAALAVPGVTELSLNARPGDRLEPLPEGGVYPGFLFARGPTADAVEAALWAGHARLRWDVEPL